MPWSDGTVNKPVLDCLATLPQPLRILDVGMGYGWYGQLVRGDKRLTVEFLAGMEIWVPYLTDNHMAPYDLIVVADARKALGETMKLAFNVVFLFDILEHMSDDESKAVVEVAHAAGAVVLITIPITPCFQGSALGNPHETHVTQHTPQRVLEKWPEAKELFRGAICGLYRI